VRNETRAMIGRSSELSISSVAKCAKVTGSCLE
jgi:hypothetical protein